MKFREFDTIKVKEISFIAQNLLDIRNSFFIKEGNQILVLEDEGTKRATLRINAIETNFYINFSIKTEYFKYLFSLGMSLLLQDNKYIKIEKEPNYDNDLWIYEEVIKNFEKDLSAIGNFEKFLKKEGYEDARSYLTLIFKDEKNEIIRKVKQVRKQYEEEKLKYEKNSCGNNSR